MVQYVSNPMLWYVEIRQNVLYHGIFVPVPVLCLVCRLYCLAQNICFVFERVFWFNSSVITKNADVHANFKWGFVNIAVTTCLGPIFVLSCVGLCFRSALLHNGPFIQFSRKIEWQYFFYHFVFKIDSQLINVKYHLLKFIMCN